VTTRARAAVRAPLLAFACVACSATAEREEPGQVHLVAASALAPSPQKLERAREMVARARPHPFDAAQRGQPFGFVGFLRRPAGGLQLSLTITEEADDGQRTVVFADQLDSETTDRFAAGIVRPPRSATWPRACHTYHIELAGRAGDLAATSTFTGNCPRAIEALRGRAIFHIGKGGPPLYDFAGTLAAYQRAIGSRRLLSAPIGREAFFLGFKAAFHGPARATSVRAILSDDTSGNAVADTTIAIDPSWDSLAGGWEIPATPDWPKRGTPYTLEIRAGPRRLARGALVPSDTEAQSPRAR
jgi:hypothetical protein